MIEAFEVGDKVTHNRYGDGEVAYGPFLARYHGDAYLLRQADGRESVVKGGNLTKLPAFIVGDTVTYAYGPGGKLVAGPFKSGYHDEAIWVVEKADGTHMTPTQNSLTKVAPANTYTHNGVTYDLTARYTDREGDVWAFTGALHEDRTPVMHCDLSGYDSIDDVVDTYGPLTRVND